VSAVKRLAVSPVAYVSWAGLVVAALGTTYFADPYIFAFTTLGLGYASLAVGLIGLPVTAFARSAGWRGRVTILLSLALTAAAVATALAVLKTFKWA
jgi:hypothetical protein